MLVMTRNEGQTIVAGAYRLTVVEIGEDVVLLRLDRQLWKHRSRRLCQFWAAVDEPFDIGSEIEAIVGKVTEIKGDRVRVGIEADREKVPVDRLEVLLEKKRSPRLAPQDSGRRIPRPRSIGRFLAPALPPARRSHEQSAHHAQ